MAGAFECLNCGIDMLADDKKNSKQTLRRRLPNHGISLGEAFSILFEDFDDFIPDAGQKVYVCMPCLYAVRKIFVHQRLMEEALASMHSRTSDSSPLKQARKRDLVSPGDPTRRLDPSVTPVSLVSSQQMDARNQDRVSAVDPTPRYNPASVGAPGEINHTVTTLGEKRDSSTVLTEELGGSKKRKTCPDDQPESSGHILKPAKRTSWQNVSFHQKMLSHLASCRYGSAVRWLLTKKAKKTVPIATRWFKRVCINEVKHYQKTTTETTGEFTREKLETFSMTEVVREAEKTMPTLVQLLRGMMTHFRRSPVSDCRVGTILCMILFNRNKSHNVFQSINSIQLWRSGCDSWLYYTLYRLGICTGYHGTRKNIDQIRRNELQEVKGWKEKIEEDLQTPLDPPPPPDTPEPTGKGRRTKKKGEKPASDTLDVVKKFPGYSLCWDLVEKDVSNRKVMGRTVHTITWAIACAVKNRVSFRHLDAEDTNIPAASLPLRTFLPSAADVTNQKRRMKIIVQRLIQRYIPHFRKHYKDCVTDHIDHAHSEEMKLKSDMVTLGVQEVNLSSVTGTLSVMDNLHKFVPEMPDGESLYAIPCHGDSISVEWMLDAARARKTGNTPLEKLQGLVPAAQEYDKSLVLLQELMDQLYRTSSSDERGTLYHARNFWDWLGVEDNVSLQLSHAPDFMRFLGTGLTCILAMKLSGMKSLNGKPKDADPSGSLWQKRVYLDDLAAEVVDFVWLQSNQKDVDDLVSSTERPSDFEYCVCRQETDEDLVECNNPVCLRGQWFHPSCVGLTKLPPDDEPWWCCKVCQQICETTEPPPVRDDGQRAQDHVQNYTRTLLWGALSDMARRDAVKEGDGPAMMGYWRSDTLNFWKMYDLHCLNIGHRLLASVNGWLPERLANELLWNRTANLIGGQGNNMELDNLNDLLAKHFKDNLSSPKSTFTDMQVQRSSHLVGRMITNMEKIYEQKFVPKDAGPTRPDFKDSDVENLIQEYLKDDLFEFLPGREHQSFPKFPICNKIPRGAILKDTLMTYSVRLDESANPLLD